LLGFEAAWMSLPRALGSLRVRAKIVPRKPELLAEKRNL
jgi:hypothetical protein